MSKIKAALPEDFDVTPEGLAALDASEGDYLASVDEDRYQQEQDEGQDTDMATILVATLSND